MNCMQVYCIFTTYVYSLRIRRSQQHRLRLYLWANLYFFLPAPTQCQFQRPSWRKNISILVCTPPTPREGDRAMYVPLASQSPYPVLSKCNFQDRNFYLICIYLINPKNRPSVFFLAALPLVSSAFDRRSSSSHERKKPLVPRVIMN